MLSKLDTKTSKSVDEGDFRIYDDSDTAKLYYMDKVSRLNFSSNQC